MEQASGVTIPLEKYQGEASGVRIPPKKYPSEASGVTIPMEKYLGEESGVRIPQKKHPIPENSVSVPGPGGDNEGWNKMAPEAMTHSIKAPEDEKKIMELWNQHMVKNLYLGDCQILKACEDFVESLQDDKKKEKIIDEGLYTAALCHFAGLYDHGLLTGKEFSHMTNMMLSYKGIVRDSD